MNTPYILYVASNSASRKRILEQAVIPFQIINQDADESLISTDQSLQDVVTQIAMLKMQHAQIPRGKIDGAICFVVTADTLGQTASGRVLHKPIDRQDAISMLQDVRSGMTLTLTGFCLRKMQWRDGAWIVLREIIDCDQAESLFNVSDEFIDFYLEHVPFLSVNGAISIEGFGGQFLQSVNGSYESVVGLPIFKLRKALFDCGFYHYDNN
jgi:septum formation protein